jgi:phosphoglycolate phosphatase
MAGHPLRCLFFCDSKQTMRVRSASNHDHRFHNMNITTILFDLDGTLTDPKAGITRCIRFSLERLGLTPPHEDHLTWCIGPPLRDSFSSLMDTSDDGLLDQALTLYRERFSRTGMFENELYPESIPALERIRSAGLRVFLATAKPRVFAVPILDHFGLTRFFHGVHGSELDGRFAHKGELIAHILDAEELDPATTLMVGDRCHDILGGRGNGILTAAVTYGYGSHEEIEESGPDMVFDSLAELAGFLEAGAVAHPGPTVTDIL